MWKQGSPRWLVSNIYKYLHTRPIDTTIKPSNLRKESAIKYTQRGLVTLINKKYESLYKCPNHGPKHNIYRNYSVTSPTTTEPLKDTISYIRTAEADALNHDERHLGRIYNMPGTYHSCYDILLPNICY